MEWAKLSYGVKRMGLFRLFSCVLVSGILLPAWLSAQASDLFFSEYIEGSSNNKALEIYNGTGREVDLSGYAVHLYTNGASIPGNRLALEDIAPTLVPGEVILLVHSGFADPPAGARAASVVNFNGDDAVALLRLGEVIDVIGTIGERENRFADVTLRRRKDVLEPSPEWLEGEWELHALDDFSGLGAHGLAAGNQPEPSAFPEELEALRLSADSWRIVWASVAGAVPAEGYVVIVTTEGRVLVPEDGVPLAVDEDLSDGLAIFTVPSRVEEVVVSALQPDQRYSVRVYPFNNVGSNIDYKSGEGAPAVEFRTERFRFHEGFETPESWRIFNADGAAGWSFEAGVAVAEEEQGESWLVSPPIDLSAVRDPAVAFRWAWVAGQSALPGRTLPVFISFDYTGEDSLAAVREATWEVRVPAIGSGDGDFHGTGAMAIRSGGERMYLGFRYGAFETPVRWMLDEVTVLDGADAIPVIEVELEKRDLIADGAPVMMHVRLPEPVSEAQSLRIEITDPLAPIAQELVIDRGETALVVAVGPLPGLELSETVEAELRVSVAEHAGWQGSLRILPVPERRIELMLEADAMGPEVAAIEAVIELSGHPPKLPWVIGIENPRPDLLEMPVSLEMEALTGRFSIGLMDERPPGESALELPIRVSTESYGESVVMLQLRAPPAREAWIELEEALIREGNGTEGVLRLKPAPSRNLPLRVSSGSDFAVLGLSDIRSGVGAIPFRVHAVAGDGFEKEEEQVLRIEVPGYPAVEKRFRVVNVDPRARWLAPAAGQRLTRGQRLLLRAQVEDPEGTMASVIFRVGELELEAEGSGPFVAEVGAGALPLGEWPLRIQVKDPVLGDWESEERWVRVLFSPVADSTDFIEQAWRDLAGRLVTEAEREHFRSMLAEGRSRGEVVAEMMGEPAVQEILDVMKTIWLCLGRFPIADELGEEPLRVRRGRGGGLFELPPMVAIARAGEATALGAGDRGFYGGLTGLADAVLHGTTEAEERFGGLVGDLKTTEFLKPVWWSLHRLEPTAQQIVQAHGRMRSFGREAPVSVPPDDYGRARLIAGLVTEETFFGGTDLIFDPPENRLSQAAAAAWLRMAFWGEANIPPESEDLIGGVDLAELVGMLLDHPRYWKRFDHVWLGARRVDGQQDYYESAWFGGFYYTADSWPWVYHREHDWIWAGAALETAEGFWYWDEELGWMWASACWPRWLYSHERAQWLLFLGGQAPHRRMLAS